MEHWKELGAPLSAVVVVLAVLLKTILDEGQSRGRKYWQGQDADVMRQTYERVTRLEAHLEHQQETLEELRQSMATLGETKASMEQMAARHIMDSDQRWRELDKWKQWVEVQLRGRGPRNREGP